VRAHHAQQKCPVGASDGRRGKTIMRRRLRMTLRMQYESWQNRFAGSPAKHAFAEHLTMHQQYRAVPQRWFFRVAVRQTRQYLGAMLGRIGPRLGVKFRSSRSM